MKNEKLIRSWNKINPTIADKNKIFLEINRQMAAKPERKRYPVKKWIFVAICITVICATSVFATYHYLNANQAAQLNGNIKLAEVFQKQGDVPVQTETCGGYTVSLLGVASGSNISDFEMFSETVNPERTYAAIAIEKTDGTPMTYDDEFLVTPLISGLTPWQYNIFTMNGGYSEAIDNGVLYRIIELDSIEYFADRTVYIAALSDTFYRTEAYNYDESTGLITRNPNYKGCNILFELKLDPAKANPKKAQEYLSEIEKEWSKAPEEENIAPSEHEQVNLIIKEDPKSETGFTVEQTENSWTAYEKAEN